MVNQHHVVSHSSILSRAEQVHNVLLPSDLPPLHSSQNENSNTHETCFSHHQETKNNVINPPCLNAFTQSSTSFENVRPVINGSNIYFSSCANNTIHELLLNLWKSINTPFSEVALRDLLTVVVERAACRTSPDLPDEALDTMLKAFMYSCCGFLVPNIQEQTDGNGRNIGGGNDKPESDSYIAHMVIPSGLNLALQFTEDESIVSSTSVFHLRTLLSFIYGLLPVDYTTPERKYVPIIHVLIYILQSSDCYCLHSSQQILRTILKKKWQDLKSLVFIPSKIPPSSLFNPEKKRNSSNLSQDGEKYDVRKRLQRAWIHQERLITIENCHLIFDEDEGELNCSWSEETNSSDEGEGKEEVNPYAYKPYRNGLFTKQECVESDKDYMPKASIEHEWFSGFFSEGESSGEENASKCEDNQCFCSEKSGDRTICYKNEGGSHIRSRRVEKTIQKTFLSVINIFLLSISSNSLKSFSAPIYNSNQFNSTSIPQNSEREDEDQILCDADEWIQRGDNHNDARLPFYNSQVGVIRSFLLITVHIAECIPNWLFGHRRKLIGITMACTGFQYDETIRCVACRALAALLCLPGRQSIPKCSDDFLIRHLGSSLRAMVDQYHREIDNIKDELGLTHHNASKEIGPSPLLQSLPDTSFQATENTQASTVTRSSCASSFFISYFRKLTLLSILQSLRVFLCQKFISESLVEWVVRSLSSHIEFFASFDFFSKEYPTNSLITLIFRNDCSPYALNTTPKGLIDSFEKQERHAAYSLFPFLVAKKPNCLPQCLIYTTLLLGIIKKNFDSQHQQKTQEIPRLEKETNCSGCSMVLRYLAQISWIIGYHNLDRSTRQALEIMLPWLIRQSDTYFGAWEMLSIMYITTIHSQCELSSSNTSRDEGISTNSIGLVSSRCCAKSSDAILSSHSEISSHSCDCMSQSGDQETNFCEELLKDALTTLGTVHWTPNLLLQLIRMQQHSKLLSLAIDNAMRRALGYIIRLAAEFLDSYNITEFHAPSQVAEEGYGKLTGGTVSHRRNICKDSRPTTYEVMLALAAFEVLNTPGIHERDGSKKQDGDSSTRFFPSFYPYWQKTAGIKKDISHNERSGFVNHIQDWHEVPKIGSNTRLEYYAQTLDFLHDFVIKIQGYSTDSTLRRRSGHIVLRLICRWILYVRMHHQSEHTSVITKIIKLFIEYARLEVDFSVRLSWIKSLASTGAILGPYFARTRILSQTISFLQDTPSIQKEIAQMLIFFTTCQEHQFSTSSAIIVQRHLQKTVEECVFVLVHSNEFYLLWRALVLLSGLIGKDLTIFQTQMTTLLRAVKKKLISLLKTPSIDLISDNNNGRNYMYTESMRETSRFLVSVTLSGTELEAEMWNKEDHFSLAQGKIEGKDKEDSTATMNLNRNEGLSTAPPVASGGDNVGADIIKIIQCCLLELLWRLLDVSEGQEDKILGSIEEFEELIPIMIRMILAPLPLPVTVAVVNVLTRLFRLCGMSWSADSRRYEVLEALASIYLHVTHPNGLSIDNTCAFLQLFGQLGAIAPCHDPKKVDTIMARHLELDVVAYNANLERTCDYNIIMYRIISQTLDPTMNESTSVNFLHCLEDIVCSSYHKSNISGRHAIKAILSVIKHTDNPIVRIEALRTMEVIIATCYEPVVNSLLAEIVNVLDYCWNLIIYQDSYGSNGGRNNNNVENLSGSIRGIEESNAEGKRSFFCRGDLLTSYRVSNSFSGMISLRREQPPLFSAVLRVIRVLQPGNLSALKQAEIWPWLYPRLVMAAQEDATSLRESITTILDIIQSATVIPPNAIGMIMTMLVKFVKQMDQPIYVRVGSIVAIAHLISHLKFSRYLTTFIQALQTFSLHLETGLLVLDRDRCLNFSRSLRPFSECYPASRVVVESIFNQLRAHNRKQRLIELSNSENQSQGHVPQQTPVSDPHPSEDSAGSNLVRRYDRTDILQHLQRGLELRNTRKGVKETEMKLESAFSEKLLSEERKNCALPCPEGCRLSSRQVSNFSNEKFEETLWQEWFFTFQRLLIVCNPQSIIQLTIKTFDSHEPLRRQLLLPSFKSLYENLSLEHRNLMHVVLEGALEGGGGQIVSICLALADYLEHNPPHVTEEEHQKFTAREHRRIYCGKGNIIDMEGYDRINTSVSDKDESIVKATNIILENYQPIEASFSNFSDKCEIPLIFHIPPPHRFLHVTSYKTFPRTISSSVPSYRSHLLSKSRSEGANTEFASTKGNMQDLKEYWIQSTITNDRKAMEEMEEAVFSPSPCFSGFSRVSQWVARSHFNPLFSVKKIVQLSVQHRMFHKALSHEEGRWLECMLQLHRVPAGEARLLARKNLQSATFSLGYLYLQLGLRDSVVGLFRVIHYLNTTPDPVGFVLLQWWADAQHAYGKLIHNSEITRISQPTLESYVHCLCLCAEWSRAIQVGKYVIQQRSSTEDSNIKTRKREIQVNGAMTSKDINEVVTAENADSHYHKDHSYFPVDTMSKLDSRKAEYLGNKVQGIVAFSIPDSEALLGLLPFSNIDRTSHIATMSSMAALALNQWDDIEVFLPYVRRDTNIWTLLKGGCLVHKLRQYDKRQKLLDPQHKAFSLTCKDEESSVPLYQPSGESESSSRIFYELRDILNKARLAVHSNLKMFLPLGYSHATMHIFALQNLEEIEEAAHFILLPHEVQRTQQRESWHRRFMAQSVENLYPFGLQSLLIYRLATPSFELAECWLYLAEKIYSLHPQTSEWILQQLQQDITIFYEAYCQEKPEKGPREHSFIDSSNSENINILKNLCPPTSDSLDLCRLKYPTVQMGCIRHLWRIGQRAVAVERMEWFLSKYHRLERTNVQAYGLAHWYLGIWKQEIFADVFWRRSQRDELLHHLHTAIRSLPASYTVWHSWALLHYRIQQRDRTLTSLERHNFVEKAHQGLVTAICCADNASKALSCILRLLQLWVLHDGAEMLKENVFDSIRRIPVDFWVEVVPQLIGHLNNDITSQVREVVCTILRSLCVHHPQAVVFPLLVYVVTENDTEVSHSRSSAPDYPADNNNVQFCPTMPNSNHPPYPNLAVSMTRQEPLLKRTENLDSLHRVLATTKPPRCPQPDSCVSVEHFRYAHQISNSCGNGGWCETSIHFRPKRRDLAVAILQNCPRRIRSDAEKVARLLVNASAVPIERILELLVSVIWSWNPKATIEVNNEMVLKPLNTILQIFDENTDLLLSSVGDIERHVRSVIDIELLYRREGKEEIREQGRKIIVKLSEEIFQHIQNGLGRQPHVAMQPLLMLSDLSICVFGEYVANPTQLTPTIISFSSRLEVIPSKKRPRHIRVNGSNGYTYSYCLKGNEDIRMDERVMQLFGLVNAIMSTNSDDILLNSLLTFGNGKQWVPIMKDKTPEKGASSVLTNGNNTTLSGEKLSGYRANSACMITRFSVVPISATVGLIGWVGHSETLNTTICEYRETISMIHKQKEFQVLNKVLENTTPWKTLTTIQRTEAFEEVMKSPDCEAVDIARAMWHRAENAEQWLERRNTFTESLATMSMVGYILGLGDRHLGNILLLNSCGKIAHIDFGDSFDVARLRLRFPETIPFRLTRMLTNAMEVFGVSGLFRSTAVRIMNMLRRTCDDIVALLSAFIYDPIVLYKGKMRNVMELSCSPQDVVEHVRRKLVGLELSLEDENHPNFFRIAHESPNRPDLYYISRAFDNRSPRVRSKTLDVESQVDMLIEEATKTENLTSLYFGWGPLW